MEISQVEISQVEINQVRFGTSIWKEEHRMTSATLGIDRHAEYTDLSNCRFLRPARSHGRFGGVADRGGSLSVCGQEFCHHD
jgi:hypothetical protein